VIGHSMGGYMAASAAARNKQVAATVLISAWNIGADYASRHHGAAAVSTVENEAKSLASDNNLLPLSGTSGEALAREIYDHQKELNFNNLATAMASRAVFIITANDGLASIDKALADALRKAGDNRVSERHWDTDHSYSGQRAELTTTIWEWTQKHQ